MTCEVSCFRLENIGHINAGESNDVPVFDTLADNIVDINIRIYYAILILTRSFVILADTSCGNPNET